MTYDEIVELALSYADRKDDETAGKIDGFMRIVEARINRMLKTQKMTARAVLKIVADQLYYGLPPDFAGLRDIQINATGDDGSSKTMKYMNPEQMNGLTQVNGSVQEVYYTIVNEQIQIHPAQLDTSTIEIVYYRNLPQLNSIDTTNWMSLHNPDGYIFGLMVEISAFVKDAEAVSLWQNRFSETIANVHNDDAISRWSGTPLQVRVG